MGKFKNHASAAASWGLVRRKLLAESAEAPRTPSTKSAAKNGSGGVANDDDDDDKSAKFTPINTPKKKKRGIKSEARIDGKTEEDENDGTAPAAVSDSVTPGETYIKTEDKEGEEAKPVLPTPPKKRARKAQDNDETKSAKRAKGAPIETLANAAVAQDGESIPRSATISPPKVDDSNLVHVETLLEEPHTQQGN